MKKLLLLLAISSAALFLGGCVYEERSVDVYRGGYSPGYYDGGSYAGVDDYDDGPYYVYGGRHYYYDGGRYRYYEGRRPVYVTVLPSGSRYVSSSHRRTQNDVAATNYRNQQAQYRYAARAQQAQNQASINQYRYQQKQQQYANQQRIKTYQYQQKQQQYAYRQQLSQNPQQAAAAAAAKKKKKKKDDD